MKTILRTIAAALALAMMAALPAAAQNEFPTPQAGKAVVGVGILCPNASGQMIPCAGGGGTATTTAASGTIAVTNTFQAALASSASRRGCVLQNQGTHTMFVFFGAIGSATTGTSLQVAPGQTVSCSNAGGLVLTDAVNVTGTSGDAYVVDSQ